jgi:hypothetical protein
MNDFSSRFRCTIIRGKSQNIIEDLIPIYCEIIKSNDGVSNHEFIISFNEKIKRFLPDSIDKTFDNHRTEISHKLYGLYYIDEYDNVRISKRASDFIESGDLTALFKSLVDLFQQPNGMESLKKINEKIDAGISFKPYHFIVSLLKIAKEKNILILKNDISYYILDTLFVLQGKISPEEVLNKIIIDRNENIKNKISYQGKSSSYCYQHTNEQINILELSGVINVNDNVVSLSDSEGDFINHLINQSYSELNFNFKFDNLDNLDNLDKIGICWDFYYNSDRTLSMMEDKAKHQNKPEISPYKQTSIDIGDEGEDIIYNHEYNRIKEFNRRLVNKIIKQGKQRGLGYDIASIWGINDNGLEPDAPFYIEVKTTKRITKPKNIKFDKFNLTRNEWLSADTHGDNYAIYRLYITRDGNYLYKIFHPLNYKEAFCVPINYNYEFNVKKDMELLN